MSKEKEDRDDDSVVHRLGILMQATIITQVHLNNLSTMMTSNSTDSRPNVM
jgi:hypothetical protein